MKASRKLGPGQDIPREVELYDRRLDNLVRVENQDAGVAIRAARGHLPPEARSAFIRYLATEGFIAERYQWCSDESSYAALGIRWTTDDSWVSFGHRRNRLLARAWAFLTWGRLLALGLFLGALVTALWLEHRR